MIRRKNVETRGKLKLSQYFQELKEGDKVSVIREHSLNPAFPERIQGKTGIIKGMRGKAYIVELKDGNMTKHYIIKPAHLKKLK